VKKIMANWSDYGDVMTVKDCAEILHISGQLVKELLRAGKLPGRKIGRAWRVNKSDLQAYLSKRESVGGFDNPKG
jgi:excisionase family DNA binding protein